MIGACVLGLRSPLGHQGYGGMMPGLAPAQHFPQGYDMMHQQLRGWNPALLGQPMPPPANTPFVAPMWQPKPDSMSAATTPPRKRRRRASSKSSNGANSDTGYTSELSSPALMSPGKNKPVAAPRDKLDNSQLPQVSKFVDGN